jgi:haloalkane dehalogenase
LRIWEGAGWGASDKPPGYSYTASNQVGDLDAVINQLQLQQVILVAHDASGPPAIDWALTHSERVAGLVLLNTYYCAMPTLRPPEAIWLFSTPLVRNIARPLSQMFGHWLFRHMYQWQVGRFFRDVEVRNKFLPVLYQQFDARPSARSAFFRLNEDLLPTIRSRTKMIPKLREFRRPVRIIFGDADPYLNRGVAQRFHERIRQFCCERQIAKRALTWEAGGDNHPRLAYQPIHRQKRPLMVSAAVAEGVLLETFPAERDLSPGDRPSKVG